MKKTIIRFACISLFVISQSAIAVPYIYTFSGQVDEIQETTNGNVNFFFSKTIGSDTFTLGETLSYEFKIDFNGAGSCFDPSSNYGFPVCDGQALINQPGIEFFEVDLHTASKSVDFDFQEIQYNYGINFPLANFNQIIAESALSVLSFTDIVQNWNIGDSFIGTDDWDILTQSYSGRITSNLTLVDIRLASKVSTAGVMSLMALGIILLYISLFYKPRINVLATQLNIIRHSI